MEEEILLGYTMGFAGAFIAFMISAILIQIETNPFGLFVWEGVGFGLLMIIFAYLLITKILERQV